MGTNVVPTPDVASTNSPSAPPSNAFLVAVTLTVSESLSLITSESAGEPRPVLIFESVGVRSALIEIETVSGPSRIKSSKAPVASTKSVVVDEKAGIVAKPLRVA